MRYRRNTAMAGMKQIMENLYANYQTFCGKYY